MADKKKGGFFSEFKTFLMRGNVLDLAVAVVIGGAFGKIVSSFVGDILMPLIGILTGKASIGDLQWVVIEATKDSAGEIVDPGVIVKYGAFVQTIVDFIIVAFAIFCVVKLFNKIKDLREKEAKEAAEKAAAEKKAAEEKAAAEKAAAEQAAADAKAKTEAEFYAAVKEIRDILKQK